MTNSKGSPLKQKQFYYENKITQEKKIGNTIEEIHFEKKEYIRIDKYLLDNSKKSDKSIQVSFSDSNESSKNEKSKENLAPTDECNDSGDYKLEIPPKKEKKEIIKDDTKVNVTNQEDKTKKSNQPKHKSTYDPKVFRTYKFEHQCGRFKAEKVQPIKLNVTLKDIGMEGFDSYKSETTKNTKEQISSKIEVKEAEETEKYDEEMRMKKIQEEWELRKKAEKEMNTYDPKIFQDPKYSPSKKPKLEEMPPIKLNVDLKDIGMEGFDSYKKENVQKNDKESKPMIQKKVEIKNDIDKDKLKEEELMKRVQEEWEFRKKVEKEMNTYDPKIFRASAYSPSKKPKPEEIPAIKLNVELKDIGMEGFDSYKKENQQEVKTKSPPKKIKFNDVETEKINEEMRLKKVQEEWELRKKAEKEMNTYSPKLFRASAFSPSKKPKTEEMPPIKLNVDLKDIGMEGFDSYKEENVQKNDKESKPMIQKKVEIKNDIDKDKLKEEELMKRVQEEWEFRKKVEKEMNTYDPKIFRASAYSPSKKPKPEEIPVIKLNVELKDIGMDGFDSYKPKDTKEVKQQIVPKKVIKKEEEDPEKLKEEMIMKKVQEEWEQRKKADKEMNTYDPKLFHDSSFSPPRKPNPEDIPAIKLNVELKDIGMEGFDSYKKENVNKNDKESKPMIPKKVEIKKEEDPEKLNEEMRMKKIQEEWELKKKVEKEMNTYDPKLFRASAYSPSRNPKSEEMPVIKLNVDLKDIGMEGFDSYKKNNTKETKQQIVPKKEIKEEDPEKLKEEEDPEKLKEEMILKKVQEEWEQRKKAEKEMNTYDPKLFRASAFSPPKKPNPDEMPVIKLNVSLKDIGMEGFDTYVHENTQEFKPFSPPKPQNNEINKNENNVSEINESQKSRRQRKQENQTNTHENRVRFNFASFPTPKGKLRRKIKQNNDDDDKKEFEIRQPTETSTHSNFRTKRRKTENSYDSSVFNTSFFTSPNKQDIKPIKLNVSLKDIGLEDFDSRKAPEKLQDTKPKICPPQTEIFILNEDEPALNNQTKKNTNVRIQKIYHNNNKRKTEKQTRKSIYDPSVFYTSSCAFTSSQFTARKYGPIKLNVTLKDIGLEGLDSI